MGAPKVQDGFQAILIRHVDLPKPRDRLALAENKDYNHLRGEVLRFLYERHAKKAA